MLARKIQEVPIDVTRLCRSIKLGATKKEPL